MKKYIFILLFFSCAVSFAQSQCLTPSGCFASNINYYNADVNWTPVNGSHHYKIRYKIIGASSWSYKNNLDSLQNLKNIANLQPLSTYIWQIRNYCDSGNSVYSGWSPLDTFITNTTLCPSPTGLSTTNIVYNTAQANWSLVQGTHRYRVHYRIYGTATWSNLGTIDSTVNNIILPLLQQNTTYEWEVMAYFDSTIQMASLWSIPDTFTTPAFVAAPFNPTITNTISSIVCNIPVDLTLKITQVANEPDIGTSTITTDGGNFQISNLSIGDTVGYASLITSTQNIFATLKVGMVIGVNYAIINSYDTTGGFIGFFAIENIANGVRVSSTSPNDGNNYTSGLISEVFFDDLFVTPNYTGELHIFTEIESELNDLINLVDTFSIECSSNIFETQKERAVIKVLDVLGREAKEKNQPLFYIYDDGSVEKRITIE